MLREWPRLCFWVFGFLGIAQVDTTWPASNVTFKCDSLLPALVCCVSCRCGPVCVSALLPCLFSTSTLPGPKVQQIHPLILSHLLVLPSPSRSRSPSHSLFALFVFRCLSLSLSLSSSSVPLSGRGLAFFVPKSNNALTHHFTLKCCKNMHKAFGKNSEYRQASKNRTLKLSQR